MALMYLARVTRKMVEQLTKSRKHAHKKLGDTKKFRMFKRWHCCGREDR